MSVKPILLLGDPRLRMPGEPVESFGKLLHSLLDDLVHTMRQARDLPPHSLANR
jgi:peptide deformylase